MDIILRSASAGDSTAREKYQQGKYEESGRLYSELLKDNPEQIAYLSGAAASFWQMGKYEKSKNHYLDIAEKALARAANAAWYACDYQAAKEIIEERTKKEKRTTELHFMLGITHHSLGELSKAAEHYQQSVRVGQKENASQWVQLAWLNLGVVYAARFGDKKEGEERTRAVEALEKSIEAAANDKERKDIIAEIQTALEPVEASDNKCGAAYYAPSDLTPLAGLPELTTLLARYSSEQAV